MGGSPGVASAGDPAATGTELESAAGKYMTFKLGAEEYGLDILVVREIIGLLEITRVPRTAPHLRGVINLRGVVIPVVDLRCRFGMEAVEPTEQTVIIVVQYGEGERRTVKGILVDEVVEVLDLPADRVAPPPPLGGAQSSVDFLVGVGRAEGRVVFLLDIERVLEGERPEAPAADGQTAA